MINPLTVTQIQSIDGASRARIKLSCVERHPHTLQQGCYVPVPEKGGDDRDVTICLLVSYIRWLQRGIKELLPKE